MHLVRGDLLVEGTVVWSSQTRCGIAFTSQVAVSQWLAPPSNAAQQRVDQMVGLVKASPSPASVADLDGKRQLPPRSQHQLVEDLNAVSRLIQDVEEDLASSPDTVMRHAQKLQNLDIAMQMLAAVGRELKPNSRDQSRSLARLEDLRVACEQALDSK